jgi:2-keto-4-pentenoate hydratase/2-oxohepta-3-ene-1,7-dioic acid hydratase in catechol pathway
MKLASFESGRRVSYGIVTSGGVIDAGRRIGTTFPDLHAVISAGAIDQLTDLGASARPDYTLDDVRFLKPIAHPGKILCVGVNYADRNAEYKDSSEQPKYPSIFVRFPESLVSQGQPLLRPPESRQLDY